MSASVHRLNKPSSLSFPDAKSESKGVNSDVSAVHRHVSFNIIEFKGKSSHQKDFHSMITEKKRAQSQLNH